MSASAFQGQMFRRYNKNRVKYNIRGMDTQQDPEQLVHNFIGLKAVHDLSKSHKWSYYVLLFGFSVTADDTLRG